MSDLAPPSNPLDFEEEEDDQREERQSFLILAFAFMTGTATHRVKQLSAAVAEGSITPSRWSKLFASDMEGHHVEASMIGRRLAGDTDPISQIDIKAGVAAWLEQEEFFQGFYDALRNGELSPAQINARSEMYVRRLKGTTTEAFRQSLADEGAEAAWLMSDTEHCEHKTGFQYTCPGMAALGTIPIQDFPTTPGACATPCLFNCACWLETADGKFSTQGI